MIYAYYIVETKLGKTTKKYTIDGREILQTNSDLRKIQNTLEDGKIKFEVGGNKSKEATHIENQALVYNPNTSTFEENIGQISRY